MHIQAPQWTEFLSCPVCYNVFNEQYCRPISLACGHTVCKTCLLKFQQRKCPFDQSPISRNIDELPANYALLQLVSSTVQPDSIKAYVTDDVKEYYEEALKCVEELALLLKPVSSTSTGSIISVTTPNVNGTPASVLSRPMQRKLITLVNCQFVEEEGRARALRAARSLGERTVTELILQHQNPQQLSSNLWAAVRGRGCQFLGPGMQEEVLKLILLALEDGNALSRKVLVLFVVQRLEAQYPQASKTAIGHVVQLLYRASCFKVTKRDEESSLMQLKEEYCTYEALRREHDSQVVQIAMEAGLRIAPDQWSSLLYGDCTHKSHMQSIIDKLQTPQTFSQSVRELLIALQRTNDPYSLSRLRPEFEFLSNIDPSPDVPSPSWENLEGVMKAVRTVVEGLVAFLQNAGTRKHDFLTPFNSRYKTSLCRDFSEKGSCPRGSSCTFAHSEEELEKYRQKSKRASRGFVYGTHRIEDGMERTSYDSNSDMQCLSLAGTKFQFNLGLLSTVSQTNMDSHLEVCQGDQSILENVQAAIAAANGNMTPSDIEMMMQSMGIVQPSGNMVKSSENIITDKGFYGPRPGLVNQSQLVSAKHFVDSPGMSPTNDSAILQSGNVVIPNTDVLIISQQQQVSQRGLSPTLQSQLPPPGIMKMTGAGIMPGCQTPVITMQGNMSQIQGIMPTYMPPYGAQGMLGPRFPMLYNQYTYSTMHQYMPYYAQGYIPNETTRMPFDSCYTSLNPCAEPWTPGIGPPPRMCGINSLNAHSFSPGQSVEKCSVCSQKQEEEKRKKHQEMSHDCNKHRPEKFSNECLHECNAIDCSRKAADNKTCISPLQRQQNNNNVQLTYKSDQITKPHNSTDSVHEKQCFLSDRDLCEQTNSNWSINDDSDQDLEELYNEKREENKRVHHHSQQQLFECQHNQHIERKPRLQQSLHSLRERRNSLIQQLQQINKEATAHGNKLEALAHNLPNLFNEMTNRFNGSQQQPAAFDPVTYNMQSTMPSNGEIFDRLGAISGIPSKSVQDSIMASWITSSLKAAETDEHADMQMSPLYSSKVEPYVETIKTMKSDDTNIVIPKNKLSQSSCTHWGASIDSDYPYWDVTSPLGLTTTSSPTITNQAHCKGYPAATNVSQMYRSPSCSVDTLYSLPGSANKIYSSPGSATQLYSSGSETPAEKSQGLEYHPSCYIGKTAVLCSNGICAVSTAATSVYTYSSNSAATSTTEEDHIPFIEGQPIISRYGPISRGVKMSQMGGGTQALKLMLDETSTAPVTALTGPPLSSAQTVPSRFQHSETCQYMLQNSSVDNNYQKSYSLWTTKVNLLEQKAMKASTEDEKLSVKLQAVQMQITLKEQELKQAQMLENAQWPTEYLKYQHDPKSSNPWNN